MHCWFAGECVQQLETPASVRVGTHLEYGTAVATAAVDCRAVEIARRVKNQTSKGMRRGAISERVKDALGPTTVRVGD